MDSSKNNNTKNIAWMNMIGDLKIVTKFLASKPAKSFWLPLIFLDALCRGFAQVLFVNNSLSGLLVIVGLFIGDPLVAAAGVFTTSVALVASVCLQQTRDSICAGLTSYSAVIVGTVVAALAPSYIPEDSYVSLWLFLFFGAIFSVYLTIALANIFKVIKPAVTCCTLPFNVVAFMILISFQFINKHQVTPAVDMDLKNATVGLNTTTCDENHVQKLFVGTLVSMSQVYAVESIPSSVIIYLGLLLSSPITTGMTFIGSAVGTFAGAAILGPAGCAPAYAGLLGFNSLLSAGGLGGFFFVMSVHSFSTAVLCALFTVVLQVAFASSLSVVSLPVCTLPFCTSTILFLATTTSHGGGLVRPHVLSFPERHLYDVIRSRRKHSLVHLSEVVNTIENRGRIRHGYSNKV